MSQMYKIGEKLLALSDISKILSEGIKIELSEKSEKKVIECRKYLEDKIKSSPEPNYGVNTGFGSLCNH